MAQRTYTALIKERIYWQTCTVKTVNILTPFDVVVEITTTGHDYRPKMELVEYELTRKPYGPWVPTMISKTYHPDRKEAVYKMSLSTLDIPMPANVPVAPPKLVGGEYAEPA